MFPFLGMGLGMCRPLFYMRVASRDWVKLKDVEPWAREILRSLFKCQTPIPILDSLFGESDLLPVFSVDVCRGLSYWVVPNRTLEMWNEVRHKIEMNVELRIRWNK